MDTTDQKTKPPDARINAFVEIVDALIKILEDARCYLKANRDCRENPSELNEILGHSEAVIREAHRVKAGPPPED